MKPQQGLYAHSLLVTANIAGGDTTKDPTHIQNVLKRLKSAGASGAELAFHPGMLSATASEIANAANATIPVMALCVFFGKDDPDPLNFDDRIRFLTRIEEAAKLANTLHGECGEAPVITGPWAFQIGRQYSRTHTGLQSVLRTKLQDVAEIARKYSVHFALEYLRPAENFAIQGPEHAFELIEVAEVSEHVGVHVDTFHDEIWGVSTAEIIRNHHEDIGWLHVSGSRRHTPGNASDNINWQGIGAAIAEKDWYGGICFEGFGPEFRKAVPEIAAGFPKDLPVEAAVPMATYTLRGAGIIA